MALSSSGSDNANPLTPALLVNWEYLSHLVSSTSFILLIFPMSGSGNKQRNKKGDRRTEVKRLTFLSFQYGLRLHLNLNQIGIFPELLGLRTPSYWCHNSSLAWFWSVRYRAFTFKSINQPRALDQLIGNQNLDLPQQLGSATHLEYVTWSDLAWLMKDLVFMTIFLKPKEELSSHRARLL